MCLTCFGHKSDYSWPRFEGEWGLRLASHSLKSSSVSKHLTYYPEHVRRNVKKSHLHAGLKACRRSSHDGRKQVQRTHIFIFNFIHHGQVKISSATWHAKVRIYNGSILSEVEWAWWPRCCKASSNGHSRVLWSTLQIVGAVKYPRSAVKALGTLGCCKVPTQCCKSTGWGGCCKVPTWRCKVPGDSRF